MKQIVRYGLVGVTSNVAIYALYILITHLGVGPKVAMTIVYVFGVAIGFVGNRNWTFSHRGDFAGTSIRYLLAHSLGYLLNFLMLLIFVDKLGYAHQWVQAGAIFVVASFLYLVLKYFVFAKEN